MSDCPYIKIGCKMTNLSNDEFDHHLQSNGIVHSKLLIDQINSLQRKINFDNYQSLVQGNTALNDKITTVAETIYNGNASVIRELADMENQIIEVKREMELLKTHNVNLKLLLDFELTDDKINTEIQLLKRGCENLSEKFNNKTKEITMRDFEKYDLNKKLDEARDISNDLFETIENTKNEYTMEFESNSTLLNRHLSNIKSDITFYHYGNFFWKINEFYDQLNAAKNGINTTIFSGDFLSHKNGYLLQLSLQPNGDNIGLGKYISIYFSIKVGPYDNVLTWPMRNEIIISIINQKTGKRHSKQNFKYSSTSPALQYLFDRPSQSECRGYGIYQFIEHDELQRFPFLLMNDQLIIKCSVK